MDARFLTLKRWEDLPRGPVWILSPRLQEWQLRIVEDLKAKVEQDPELIWILSSGTQSVNSVKAIGHTRTTLLSSAASVNRHLESTSKDHWLVPIPTYHVGGLAILARAYLSGARVSFIDWEAERFVRTVSESWVTLSSLVPTQIYDLVRLQMQAPPTLRAIVVGGGSLDENLYRSARKLGWPLLPSYGLTETASQVATASLESLNQKSFPELGILSHAQIELRDQQIFIKSSSLCKWVVTADTDGDFHCDQQPVWLTTEDLGEFGPNGLRILGRRDSIVKILGVLVPLSQVENDIKNVFEKAGLGSLNLTVVTRPSERAGHELFLVTDSELSLVELAMALEKYNRKVPGPQRVAGLCWVPEVPVGDLGKVKKSTLLRRLSP